MADSIDLPIDDNQDDAAAEPELDIAVGEAPLEAKPDVVTLSPAEFAALKAQGDSAAAIAKGIESLGSRMGAPAQAAPPANTPVQTPEEFFAEHSDDLFDKEKGAKLMAEYNKRLMEREYGPMFANVSSQLASTKRDLLAARDPLFKKYEAEIEALVKSQPQNVQVQPDVYDRAWLTIREKHRSEIEEETVNARVNEAVAKALKEAGIEPGKKGAGDRPPAYENSASRSAGAAPAAGKRTVRLPNEETRKKLENEARRRGIDMADLLRSKGYMS
jgi:hypothetical protein